MREVEEVVRGELETEEGRGAGEEGGVGGDMREWETEGEGDRGISQK